MHLAHRAWQPPGDRAPSAREAVLIHGVNGWSVTWWRIGPALASLGWRVIALDQRCHGQSGCQGPFTLDDLAADAAETIDALLDGRRPELIIGHSLGAMTTLTLLRHRPDAAQRVVLEDPPGRSDERDFPTVAARWREDVLRARESPADAAAAIRADNPRWADGDVTQEVDGLARSQIDTIVASFSDRWQFDTPSLLASVRVPVLLVLGDEARGSVITEATRREAIDRLPPGSAWRTFDAGHVIHRDRFEEYAAAVRAFVDA